VIHLQKAVKQIAEEMQQVKDDVFLHASTGPESHLLFVKAVGRIQGLNDALEILLGITKGEDERD
jgi:hypothetical protein